MALNNSRCFEKGGSNFPRLDVLIADGRHGIEGRGAGAQSGIIFFD
jgi:hypothetical protein